MGVDYEGVVFFRFVIGDLFDFVAVSVVVFDDGFFVSGLRFILWVGAIVCFVGCFFLFCFGW